MLCVIPVPSHHKTVELGSNSVKPARARAQLPGLAVLARGAEPCWGKGRARGRGSTFH